MVVVFISTVVQNSIVHYNTCPCCVLLSFDILSRASIDRLRYLCIIRTASPIANEWESDRERESGRATERRCARMWEREWEWFVKVCNERSCLKDWKRETQREHGETGCRTSRVFTVEKKKRENNYYILSFVLAPLRYSYIYVVGSRRRFLVRVCPRVCRRSCSQVDVALKTGTSSLVPTDWMDPFSTVSEDFRFSFLSK